MGAWGWQNGMPPGMTRHCLAGKLAVCKPGAGPRRRRRRAGAASLDYVLILGVVLPMVVVILRVAPRMIRLAYEMLSVLVSWPFM